MALNSRLGGLSMPMMDMEQDFELVVGRQKGAITKVKDLGARQARGLSVGAPARARERRGARSCAYSPISDRTVDRTVRFPTDCTTSTRGEAARTVSVCSAALSMDVSYYRCRLARRRFLLSTLPSSSSSFPLPVLRTPLPPPHGQLM
eukprot:scaffold83753_cov72-Phaeocystis_antarctica.AAC.1